MSGLISIAVDVTLTASWWIVKKTTYGIYSGVHYLMYGNVETETDKDRKKLIQRLEYQDKLLKEVNKKLDLLPKKNNTCENINENTNEDTNEDDLPPSYDNAVLDDFNVITEYDCLISKDLK